MDKLICGNVEKNAVSSPVTAQSFVVYLVLQIYLDMNLVLNICDC